MTLPCSHLDEFFDGELAAEAAATFRAHLATCDRCQRQLSGRMQEAMVVDEAAPVVIPIAHARARKNHTRAIALAGMAVAIAAAVVLVVWSRKPAKPPQLAMAYTVEHTGATMRGADAHAGDIVHIHSADTVWVYRNDHELVLVCSEGTCDFTVPSIGAYSIVVLAGTHLPSPKGNLDADIAAANVAWKIVPLTAD